MLAYRSGRETLLVSRRLPALSRSAEPPPALYRHFSPRPVLHDLLLRIRIAWRCSSFLRRSSRGHPTFTLVCALLSIPPIVVPPIVTCPRCLQLTPSYYQSCFYPPSPSHTLAHPLAFCPSSRTDSPGRLPREGPSSSRPTRAFTPPSLLSIVYADVVLAVESSKCSSSPKGVQKEVYPVRTRLYSRKERKT